jgi:hypothetical protein
MLKLYGQERRSDSGCHVLGYKKQATHIVAVCLALLSIERTWRNHFAKMEKIPFPSVLFTLEPAHPPQVKTQKRKTRLLRAFHTLYSFEANKVRRIE